jgi:ankyrin repeat protein
VRKAGVSGSNNPAPEGSGRMDSLEFVRKLVAKGAALNAQVAKKPSMGVTTLNSVGATPLLLAARTADADLMRLLASLGADPRTTNEDGTTPLMVAAGLGTGISQGTLGAFACDTTCRAGLPPSLKLRRTAEALAEAGQPGAACGVCMQCLY